MVKVLLKMLAILLMSMPTACATLFNSGGDRQITLSSDNPQTKFYHNGKFIGRGYTATTHASGSGSDILTGIQKGCTTINMNVKKGVSPTFVVGNFGMFALFIVIPMILGVPVSPYYLSDAALYAFLGIDAASGSWRKVTHTEYDLTPECGAQR